MPISSTWIKNKETLLVLQTLLNLRTLQNPLTQHLEKASSSTTLSRNPTTVTPLRSNYVSLVTRADRSKSFGALQALQTETSGDSRFKSSLATFTCAHKHAQNVTYEHQQAEYMRYHMCDLVIIESCSCYNYGVHITALMISHMPLVGGEGGGGSSQQCYFSS